MLSMVSVRFADGNASPLPVCQQKNWHRQGSSDPILPYNKFINARHPMQLQTSATQIDFYPVAGGKRFVKRVIWHPGAESEMISFSTVVKTDAMYSIRNLIANGAEVTDFNTEAYQGDDYSPVYC